MIEITEKYAIEIDSYNYITGIISHDKKNNKTFLTNRKYFTTIYSAIDDIAERTLKDKIKNLNLNLNEAVKEIKDTYSKFSKKLDQLEKFLKNDIIVRDSLTNNH